MKTKLLLLTVLALIILSVCTKATKKTKATKVTKDTSADSAEEKIVEEADDDFPGFKIDDEQQMEKIEETTGYLEGASDDAEEEEEEEEEQNTVTPQQETTEPKQSEGKIINDLGDGAYDAQMRRCDYAEIPFNKQATKNSANDVYKLYRVLLTSTRIEDCVEISEFDCPEIGFCTTWDPKESPEGVEVDCGTCDFDTLYLYPIAESPEMVINFEYKVITDDAPPSDDTAGSGNNDPQTEQPQDDQSGQNQPDQTQDGQTEGPQVNEPTEGDNVQTEGTQDDQNPPVNQQHVGKAIGIAILSIMILFILVVCVYRCQFRKSGEGCFNPPSWCPGFIFPRQKASSFAPIHVDRSHELADYEPPVPVL